LQSYFQIQPRANVVVDCELRYHHDGDSWPAAAVGDDTVEANDNDSDNELAEDIVNDTLSSSGWQLPLGINIYF
jgi:hypothetical protein